MENIKIKILPEGYRRLVEKAISYRNELAEMIKDTAKDIVPVRTGKLRDSIEVVNSREESRIIGDTDYSIFVELGTRHMQAQPFLEPALMEVIHNVNGGKLQKNVIPPTHEPTYS